MLLQGDKGQKSAVYSQTVIYVNWDTSRSTSNSIKKRPGSSLNEISTIISLGVEPSYQYFCKYFPDDSKFILYHCYYHCVYTLKHLDPPCSPPHPSAGLWIPSKGTFARNDLNYPTTYLGSSSGSATKQNLAHLCKISEWDRLKPSHSIL